MGAVNDNKNAQPSGQVFKAAQRRANKRLLFVQPLLFSKRVKASLVETLLSPEQTNRAIIAAIVVPTRTTRINGDWEKLI
jgi:hypothetical protein